MSETDSLVDERWRRRQAMQYEGLNVMQLSSKALVMSTNIQCLHNDHSCN